MRAEGMSHYMRRKFCNKECLNVWQRGKHHSINTEFKKNNVPWIKGLHVSNSPKTQFKKGQYKNEKHPLWKGSEASYSAIHQWVSRNYGTEKDCENCHSTIEKRYEWANISGDYKRERKDWKRLCAKCHHAMDDITNKGWITRRRWSSFA